MLISDDELKEFYSEYANENDGLISIDDLLFCLNSIGLDLDEQKFSLLLNVFGITEEQQEIEKKFNFEEFIELYNMAMEDLDELDYNLSLFKQIDKNQKGYLNINDLRVLRDQILSGTQTKMTLTDQDLVDMIIIANHPNEQRVIKDDESNESDLVERLFDELDLQKGDNDTMLKIENLKVTKKQFLRLIDYIDNS